MGKDQASAVLAALPWRCFHCDFITNDRVEAAAHFGDSDDAGEVTPLCKWWSNMDDQERKEQFQSLIQELNYERRRCESLQSSNEGLEYQVQSQESVIKSYKAFRNCRSINDVFNLYDTMEGRALTAEEKLRQIEQRQTE
jgi:hypothetical protein